MEHGWEVLKYSGGNSSMTGGDKSNSLVLLVWWNDRNLMMRCKFYYKSLPIWICLRFTRIIIILYLQCCSSSLLQNCLIAVSFNCSNNINFISSFYCTLALLLQLNLNCHSIFILVFKLPILRYNWSSIQKYLHSI